jgi:hypothetical protein
VLAEPTDLQIVCNLTTLEYRPAQESVLDVIEIRNHPDYSPLTSGDIQNSGPIGGFDISVYIVNDTNFAMNPKFVWPACLPKSEDVYVPGNRGILAAWRAPAPPYFFDQNTLLDEYNKENFYEREALLEQITCSDPDWMKSDTFHPAGTLCFSDAAWASSVDFGMSGSGVVRPFLVPHGNRNVIRYSWAGPLSFSKGSDLTVQYIPGVVPQKFSSNPTVFTDARCYLDWIAAQYNLSLPTGYSPPATCTKSSGSKSAGNNSNCLSRTFATYQGDIEQILPCNFSTGGRCRLYSYNPDFRPATNTNFFYCNNTNNARAICANDCPGVDPNAVVIGGTPTVFAVAAAVSFAPQLLPAVLGAGSLLSIYGLGSMAQTNSGAPCPPGQCRGRLVQRCCRLVNSEGRLVCPLMCN